MSERSDTVVTSIYFGSVAVGLHRFAVRFVDVLVALFSGPFLQVSLPELARLQADRGVRAAHPGPHAHQRAAGVPGLRRSRRGGRRLRRARRRRLARRRAAAPVDVSGRGAQVVELLQLARPPGDRPDPRWPRSSGVRPRSRPPSSPMSPITSATGGSPTRSPASPAPWPRSRPSSCSSWPCPCCGALCADPFAILRSITAGDRRRGRGGALDWLRLIGMVDRLPGIVAVGVTAAIGTGTALLFELIFDARFRAEVRGRFAAVAAMRSNHPAAAVSGGDT
ncbi:MAG: hypothetical protein R2695_05110 [Acidimicrobiales bacterium]